MDCVLPSGTCFPVGTSTVTCTATDGSGQQTQCSFHVTVLGAISGTVFFDAACNGARDNGDTPINGWKVQLRQGTTVIATVFTNSSGSATTDAATLTLVRPTMSLTRTALRFGAVMTGSSFSSRTPPHLVSPADPALARLVAIGARSVASPCRQ